MQFIHRHDKTGRLRFAALQTPGGRALAQARGLAVDNPSTFYVILKDEVLGDAAALRFVGKHLQAPWSILGAPAYLPSAFITPLYRTLARNRYAIAGRRSACYVPSPEEKERFLV